MGTHRTFTPPLPVDEKSVALRRSLVAALNAADANFDAAAERHTRAEQALQESTQGVGLLNRAYREARNRLLGMSPAEDRLAALDEIEQLARRMHVLAANVQRARSESGTARALYEDRLEVLRAARAALARSVVELADEADQNIEAVAEASEASS